MAYMTGVFLLFRRRLLPDISFFQSPTQYPKKELIGKCNHHIAMLVRFLQQGGAHIG